MYPRVFIYDRIYIQLGLGVKGNEPEPRSSRKMGVGSLHRAATAPRFKRMRATEFSYASFPMHEH